jgi:hypothetical protein
LRSHDFRIIRAGFNKRTTLVFLKQIGVKLAIAGSSLSVPLVIDVIAAGCAVASFGTFFSMPWCPLVFPIAAGMVAHAARWALISVARGYFGSRQELRRIARNGDRRHDRSVARLQRRVARRIRRDGANTILSAAPRFLSASFSIRSRPWLGTASQAFAAAIRCGLEIGSSRPNSQTPA